jgi:hypothetical protein
MNKKIIFRAQYTKLLYWILLASLTVCGVGCSGSTDSTSSDGKNIQVATGTIIGFGSVIVNGIRYTRKAGLADDRVKLGFENISNAKEDDLRVGMIVKVTGAVDATTDTGEYESIEFQPEIRGPLDVSGVDTAKGTFTVMGRTIQVDSNTNFESIRDLSEIGSELQAGNHPELEISGNLDNGTGILHATRVARKENVFNVDSPVQIKGEISNLNVAGGSFTIGSVSVKFDAAALGADTVSADIASGAVFEVKGKLNGTVINATLVEKKNAIDAVVNTVVCIKGTVAPGIGDKNLTINGPNGAITVNDAAAYYQNIATAGTTLNVEGKVQPNGTITATRIYIDTDKSVKLEGNYTPSLTDVLSKPGILTLNGVTVAIAATTRLAAYKGKPLDDLAQINAGDHLQIVGIFDAVTKKVRASQVQVTTASTYTFIQGPVTEITSTKLTLIGMITVEGAAGGLKFFDDRTGIHTPIDGQAAFTKAATDANTAVKATGTISGTVLTATELALEQAL